MSLNSEYKSPEKILYELGITSPDEIDIEAIAEYCKATVLYEPLSGCEARILGYGDRAIITVNSESRLERQRFSAAHELGHWMYDRGNIAFVCTDKMFCEEWFKSNKESKANRFAADILLPTDMFKSYAKKREITFNSVKELSKTFRTSLTATAITLVEHGSYPAMIVCSDSRGRRWFNRGPDVPNTIWPNDLPGKDSLAYDILHGKTKEAGPEDVYASTWINHPDSPRYEVREHSIRISSELVLTLIWWKNEKQLIDIVDEDDRE